MSNEFYKHEDDPGHIVHTPETEHHSEDDDAILVAALKRAGMRFDSEIGWYWPFTEYQPPVYSDAPGYSESTQPYLW